MCPSPSNFETKPDINPPPALMPNQSAVDNPQVLDGDPVDSSKRDITGAADCHDQSYPKVASNGADSMTLHKQTIQTDTKSPKMYLSKEKHLGTVCRIVKIYMDNSSGDPPNYQSLSKKAELWHDFHNAKGGPLELNRSIDYRRMALELCPSGSPIRVQAMENLAQPLWTRYDKWRDIQDLSEAILLWRRILGLLPPGHPDLSETKLTFGGILLIRYDHKRNREDLNEAIKQLRECLRGDNGGSSFAHSLASLLVRDISNLERAVGYFRKYLSSGKISTRDSLERRSLSLHRRFQQLGELRDRDEAIACIKRAIALSPLGDPKQIQLLMMSTGFLASHFEQHRDTVQLREVMVCFRESLQGLSLDTQDRLKALTGLGRATLLHYRHHGDSKSLDEGVACYMDALGLRGIGVQDKVATLSSLASALESRYHFTGNVQDLAEAIIFKRELLELHPHGHRDRYRYLTGLAGSLLYRCRREGKVQDIEDAISLEREALIVSPGHHQQLWCSNTLAVLLMARFSWHGDVDNLEEAIMRFRQSLPPIGVNDPERGISLNSLGAALQVRFKHRGAVGDIKEAIESLREVVRMSRFEQGIRWSALSNLGSCLLDSFQNYGDLKDLDEAIVSFREALQCQTLGHDEEAGFSSNLAGALLRKYEHLGDLTDVEEAIGYLQRSLDLRPVGHLGRPITLNNLAGALLYRRDQRSEANSHDLDQAIIHYREILILRPPEHPERATNLHNLAGCLQIRSKQLFPELLDEAVDYHLQGLSLRQGRHPERPKSLNYVALTLLERFHIRRDVHDLENSISYYQEALRISSPQDVRTTEWMAGLASAYVAYSTLPGRSDRLQEAAKLFEKAVNHPTSSLHDRFLASLKWVTTNQLDNISLLHAYRKCLQLADGYLLVKSSILSRHKVVVSNVPLHLASDAASCAIEAGQYETAVEFLEHGRTLLWLQMGRYRTPVDSLRDADPRLAKDLVGLSRKLEKSAVTISREGLSSESIEAEARQYRELASEWDETVMRIRKLDGFQNFLKATPFEVLKQASGGGPVVILNVSQRRSDAIIIQKDLAPLLLPLHTARLEDIDSLASQFSIAVLPTTGVCNREAKIVAVLRELWDDIVGPVVKRLQEIGITPGTRIWWCPTSRLSSLPLHAAGTYRNQEPSVMDIYVSSYTPTLTALIKTSQRNTCTSSPLPRLLLVAQPNVSGQSEIHSALEEIRGIERIVPSVDILLNNEGGRKAVLAGLQTHSWVHFACHGTQDSLEPFQSRFHLYDEALSLLDVIQARLPDAEFAYSAACHSAAGDKNRPDEIIHLAAGLQFAGFKSVIGTLYAMADMDGPLVAEEVYRHLFRRVGSEGSVVDFRDAAEALNFAVKKLRDTKVPLGRWINFIHMGS